MRSGVDSDRRDDSHPTSTMRRGPDEGTCPSTPGAVVLETGGGSSTTNAVASTTAPGPRSAYRASGGFPRVEGQPERMDRRSLSMAMRSAALTYNGAPDQDAAGLTQRWPRPAGFGSSGRHWSDTAVPPTEPGGRSTHTVDCELRVPGAARSTVSASCDPITAACLPAGAHVARISGRRWSHRSASRLLRPRMTGQTWHYRHAHVSSEDASIGAVRQTRMRRQHRFASAR